MSRRVLRRRLSAVLACDLLLFTVFMLHAPITEGMATAQGPTSAALAAQTAGGRFIIYDPDELETAELYALGQTDLNVFGRLGSAQGYTALTDGAYNAATGSHYQEDLDPASLRGPVWDTLNVHTLLSLPGYFVTPITVPPAASLSSLAVPFPPHPSPTAKDYTGAPLPTDVPVVIGPGRSHTWYLGGVLTVTRWSVPLGRGRVGQLQAGEITPTGGVRWLPPRSGSGRTLAVGGTASDIAGVVVRNRSRRPVVVQVPVALTAQAGAVALDGRMQFGVHPYHWRFVGTMGSFGVFENLRAHGWAWATGPSGGPPSSPASVATGAPAEDGDQDITVRSAAPVDLVRSMAWTPGWRATITPLAAGASGPTKRTVPITQDGVIQEVALPPGDWRVSFTYAPTSTVVALVASGVVAVLLVLGGGVEAVLVVMTRRRRRRSGGGGAGQAGDSSPMASAARP